MRICFVTGEYPPMQGGVGDCTYELGCALMQLGHQVMVVTSTKAIGTAPHSQALEPQVHPIVDRWNWSSWRHIMSQVQSDRSEVLHIHYQTAAYAMHPAINLLPLRARWSSCRPQVVVTFHDLRVPYLFPKAGAIRSWANLQLARWSDAAIVTNQEDHRQLKMAGPPTCLRWIPIGSNIAPHAPEGYARDSWRRRLGVAPSELLLCYFGFLNESKGGATLVRCLAALRDRGCAAKLVMIGGHVGDSDPTNVAFFEHVRALAVELGLADWIHWTGYVPSEQVTASFWAADVCVLPYRDGVSFRRGSFMAALAHGMPIVSTLPQHSNPLLTDGANILLVPPDDPASTAEAVERIASAPGLRDRLSRGASALAEHFTWERIAAETAELFRELRAQRG